MILRSPDKCCSQAGSADAVTFRSPTLVPNALVRCYAPAPNGGVGGVAGPAHHPFGRRPLELCSERLREIKRRRENDPADRPGVADRCPMGEYPRVLSTYFKTSSSYRRILRNSKKHHLDCKHPSNDVPRRSVHSPTGPSKSRDLRPQTPLEDSGPTSLHSFGHRVAFGLKSRFYMNSSDQLPLVRTTDHRFPLQWSMSHGHSREGDSVFPSF